MNPPDITTITTSLGEGAFMIKGLDYYLYASRGICCKGLKTTYHIVTGRSKDIKDPYLNNDGESWVDNNYSIFLKVIWKIRDAATTDFLRKMIRPLFCIILIRVPPMMLPFKYQTALY